MTTFTLEAEWRRSQLCMLWDECYFTQMAWQLPEMECICYVMVQRPQPNRYLEREKGCPRRAWGSLPPSQLRSHHLQSLDAVWWSVASHRGELLSTPHPQWGQEPCLPPKVGFYPQTGRSSVGWPSEPGRALAHGVFRTATDHHPGFPVHTPSQDSFSPTISPLVHI